MTQRTDYIGWTNRETWLINLHFEPRNQGDIEWLRLQLETSFNEMTANHFYGNFFNDLINFQLINWDELANHVQENYEEE